MLLLFCSTTDSMPGRKSQFDTEEFIQVLGLLIRRVRQASASQELSLTESAVLGRLAREGPAVTAELARAEAVRPQSMGTTVATLEQAGLVQRTPHPSDGRRLQIELTPKGATARETIRAAKRTWLAEAVAQLAAEDQATLAAAANIIRRLVEL